MKRRLLHQHGPVSLSFSLSLSPRYLPAAPALLGPYELTSGRREDHRLWNNRWPNTEVHLTFSWKTSDNFPAHTASQPLTYCIRYPSHNLQLLCCARWHHCWRDLERKDSSKKVHLVINRLFLWNIIILKRIIIGYDVMIVCKSLPPHPRSYDLPWSNLCSVTFAPI